MNQSWNFLLIWLSVNIFLFMYMNHVWTQIMLSYYKDFREIYMILLWFEFCTLFVEIKHLFIHNCSYIFQITTIQKVHNCEQFREISIAQGMEFFYIVISLSAWRKNNKSRCGQNKFVKVWKIIIGVIEYLWSLFNKAIFT